MLQLWPVGFQILRTWAVAGGKSGKSAVRLTLLTPHLAETALETEVCGGALRPLHASRLSRTGQEPCVSLATAWSGLRLSWHRQRGSSCTSPLSWQEDQRKTSALEQAVPWRRAAHCCVNSKSLFHLCVKLACVPQVGGCNQPTLALLSRSHE